MSVHHSITRHITSDNPRVMVVDGSKLVRRMIEQVLKQALPQLTVVSCESGAAAKDALQSGVVDLITMALRLPDMDGMELARFLREHAPQAFIPIIVVSGDANERLLERSFTDDVTDYFDKSLGFASLAEFIRGYVHPQDVVGGEVLYVEDSKVVAVATRRMLEKHGLKVNHVVSVEDALVLLDGYVAEGRAPGPDIVLTDVYLKGGLTGHDLLEQVRGRFGYARAQLPVLVMTGDDNPANPQLEQQLGDQQALLDRLLHQIIRPKSKQCRLVGRIMRAKVAAKAS